MHGSPQAPAVAHLQLADIETLEPSEPAAFPTRHRGHDGTSGCRYPTSGALQQMPTSPKTWGQSIRAYTTALRAAEYAPGTITLYRHYLDQVRVASRKLSPWHVSTGDLERVMTEKQAWSRSARKSFRTAVTGFYRWAHRRGYITADPTVDLLRIRTVRGIPRPIPEAVLRAALRQAARREQLMVRLGAFAGLRAAEIAKVHRDDLGADGVLIVHGKGSKVRRVPLTDSVLLVAIRSSEAWLFPNGYGSHLTPNRVSKLLAATLPDNWTAHSLRHRFACSVYEQLGDVYVVAELLGHESVQTTRTYVQMPVDRLRLGVAAAGSAGA